MCYQGLEFVVKLKTVGLDTVSLNTVDLTPVGWDTVSQNNVGLYNVGPDIVGLESVGLDVVGLDTVTLPNIVWLNAVVQDIGPVWGYSDNCQRKVLIYCPGQEDLSSQSLTSDFGGDHPGKCCGFLAEDGQYVAGSLGAGEVIVHFCGEHDACLFLRGDVVALVALLLCCLYLHPKVFPLLGGPGAGLDAWRQWCGSR